MNGRRSVLRSALGIVGLSACVVGLCGGAIGLLVGVFAPGIATGLYALDGPDPPPSFSPVAFGLQFGLGVGMAWGAGLGLLLAVVATSHRMLVPIDGENP